MKTNLPKQFGVFCECAIKHDPKAGPKYVRGTRKEASALLPTANRECASKAKHYVKEIRQ